MVLVQNSNKIIMNHQLRHRGVSKRQINSWLRRRKRRVELMRIIETRAIYLKRLGSTLHSISTPDSLDE